MEGCKLAKTLGSEIVNMVAQWPIGLKAPIAYPPSYFVVVFVPIGAVVLFWMVHVLPEKIAHKRHHPQRDAIHTLCLLSLVFGGLLWPIAWLWAYVKPVGYRMAYGTDKHEDYFHEMGGKAQAGQLLFSGQARSNNVLRKASRAALRSPRPRGASSDRSASSRRQSTRQCAVKGAFQSRCRISPASARVARLCSRVVAAGRG